MSRAPVTLGLTCALALLIAAAEPARANDSAGPIELTADQQAEYEELTKKGIMEYDLDHWAEAKTYFLRAHTLFPNARTLRALGLIAFELRSYVESLDWLERALASKQKPLTEAMRKGVNDVAKDARAFVAQIWLVLEPANATVFVDGEPVKLRDQGVLLVDPGEHELRIEAAGHQTLTRPLKVTGGQSSELELRLLAADGGTATTEVAATPATSDSAARDEHGWSTQRIVAVGLGAGAVAAFGVGLAAGLLALSAKSDSDEHCDGNTCTPAGTAERKTAVTRADIASVGFIAGGALLAAATITFFLAPDPERPSAQLSLRPGPGLVGLELAGRL
jgi:hypothetical protein